MTGTRCGFTGLSAKPRGRRSGLLFGGALGILLGAGQPANALVIDPMFDTCWTAGCTVGTTVIAPAPAAAKTAVNNVIAEYEAFFSNPITITVSFGWGETAGSLLPANMASATFPQIVTGFPNPADEYTLAATKGFYATAVGLQPTNAVLATADAHLPATYPNPGGLTNNFFIPDAEYLALNGVAQNANAINAYAGFATNLCSGATCPSSFTALAEHEIAHDMGRVDWAFSTGPGTGTTGGAPPFLTTLDFFKYDPGTTNLDPKFVQTSFSYDGGMSNPGGRTFANTSDSSDWIGVTSDSYNISVASGAMVSTADILEMCALGWNDSAVCSVPEPGSLALLGSALLGFAALRRRRT